MRNALLLIAFSGMIALSGCSKSSAPGTGAKSATPPATESQTACEPTTVAALVAEIAKEETAKTNLETAAKNTPEKTHFRKLYDAEIAFAASGDVKLARMKNCGADTSTLSAAEAKVAKAKANILYLAESFPDFK